MTPLGFSQEQGLHPPGTDFAHGGDCMAPVLPRQAQQRGKYAMAAGYEYTRQ